MCLRRHRGQDRAITTKKHYMVWKKGRGLTVMVSPFRNFCYIFGKEYCTNLRSTRCTVDDGFHSMRQKSCRGKWRWNYGLTNTSWFPCIIPTGSEVYYGKDGDVASNKIIVFRNIKELNKWYKEN